MIPIHHYTANRLRIGGVLAPKTYSAGKNRQKNGEIDFLTALESSQIDFGGLFHGLFLKIRFAQNNPLEGNLGKS
jgi:hypothetical protein